MRRLYLLISILLIVGCVWACAPRSNQDNNNLQKPPIALITIEEKQKEIVRLRGEIAALQAEVKEQTTQETAAKALWVGRVAGIIAMLALVASFFLSAYPIIPIVLRQGALILGGVSVLCFAAAHLAPYLTLIGIAAGIILIGVCIWGWRRDRQSLIGAVKGVNELKPLVSDYKVKLKKHIDSKADKWIDSVRKRL